MKSTSLSASETLIKWNSPIATGDLSSIRTMFEKGEISAKDKLGEYALSPLHLAAWYNQPEICQFLISRKVSANTKESFSGKTPLHIAAYFGHLEVAEILINHGAHLDSRKSVDILGCHPFHYAALGEKEKMLFFFLGLKHLVGPIPFRVGFSAKTVSCIGNTLDILIRKRNLALCDLVSSAEGISIVETNPRCKSAMYVGYSNENPWTPFHSAAILGEKKIVEMLLRRFPHAYCLSKEFAHLFDYSPGEVALAEGQIEVARMLGESQTVLSGRKAFNHFSMLQNAPSHLKNLLKAIEERDFIQMDKLIAEYGENILYQCDFCELHEQSFYWNLSNLNAFSVVSRLFCVSFADWLKKNRIQVSPQEFLKRDPKETVFFNWSMIDTHPYATGFFDAVSKEIILL